MALSGTGDTLAVAAAREDSLSEDAGVIYVFARDGRSWSYHSYAQPSSPEPGGNFGWRLTLSNDGNTLAAAAARHQDYVTTGKVYVFGREGATWPQQFVRDAPFWDNDGLGPDGDVALSGDGDTLAVGAAWPQGQDAGEVKVYVRGGAGWSLQQSLTSSNLTYRDRFGCSVSLSDDGDTLAVGAYAENSPSTGIDQDDTNEYDHERDPGAAYLFVRDGHVWSQQVYFKASNTGDNDRFGYSVALSGDGDTLAVGAPSEASSADGIGGEQDDDTSVDAGAVYVFVRQGPGWEQQSYLKAGRSGGGDLFGSDIALSNDSGSLVVGAPGENFRATGVGSEPNSAAFDSGAVFLY